MQNGTDSASVHIGGTAIRFCDLGTIALPLPASHDDIRELVEQVHGSRAGKHHGDIGYVTGQGRFVKPREALLIARQARQLRTHVFRSEDLEFANLLAPHKRGTVPQTRRELYARPEEPPRPPTHAPIAVPRVKGGVNALATNAMLRRDLANTAKFTVTASVIAGIVSFYLSSPLVHRGWSAALGIQGFQWTAFLAQLLLSALTGLAFALVIHAKGSEFRGGAIKAFLALLGLGCLWGASVNAGLGLPAVLLLILMFPLALITVSLFGKIRATAALLMTLHVPWVALLAYSMAVSAPIRPL